MATEEKVLSADELWAAAQKDRAAATEAAPAQTTGAEATAGTPAPTTADAKTEAGKTSETDPYDGLSGPVRKLLQGLDEKVKAHDAETAKLRQQLATAHGTIGNLKQRFDSELGRIKPTVDAVEAQKKADAEKEKAEREAKRKERRERLGDLPDVLAELDDIRADAQPAKEVKPETAQQQTTETVIELPADREARLIAERELSDLHPKWIETVRSAEFKAWRDAQPAAIQALGASEDIADAAKMLDAYKQHREDAAKVAAVEAERQARLSRGESVQGRGSSQQQGAEPSQDALWEQAKRDREKARAEARA